MRERLVELLKSKSCRENLCMGKNCADCVKEIQDHPTEKGGEQE